MRVTLNAQLAEAQRAGSRLPPLLVAAERVAATVAQGVHGRRRIGVGDSFWQYRPFVEGDSASRIDWRRSARSDRTYVRDMEWEAAQTVCVWHDTSPSMDWRSSAALPLKKDRAALLLLALSSLLFRAGELVRAIGVPRVFSGRQGLAPLAMALPEAGTGLPAAAGVPRYSRAVLIGDFFEPMDDIQASLSHFAELPARVHFLQVLDPAEMTLPYEGRVRFLGLEQDGTAVIPRVPAIRDDYAAALRARMDALHSLAARFGGTLGLHTTDQPPETALLALYQALDASGERR
jgi:uncharacterized protein (DUF58 family)